MLLYIVFAYRYKIIKGLIKVIFNIDDSDYTEGMKRISHQSLLNEQSLWLLKDVDMKMLLTFKNHRGNF